MRNVHSFVAHLLSTNGV